MPKPDHNTCAVSQTKAIYFNWLDAARGFAALSVLFWHYTHFFYVTTGSGIEEMGIRTEFPLYNIFWLFYSYGLYAVQFFWMLSGFVFAHTYANKSVTGAEYAVARFARLYPLHFATLLIVAGLQIISMQQFGHHQMFMNTDMENFVRHVFMVSGWGFSNAFTYNASIWSVSAEIAVYIVFFFLIKTYFFKSLVGKVITFSAAFLLNGMVGFLPLTGWNSSYILGCAVFFFAGSLLHSTLRQTAHRNYGIAVAAVFLVVGMVQTTNKITTISLLPLFMGAIYILGYLDIKEINGAKFFAPLAAITYTVYLIHVPFQMAIIMTLDAFEIGRGVALTWSFFVTYFGSVILIAMMVYKYFERPLDRKIRKVGKAYFAARDHRTAAQIPAE